MWKSYNVDPFLLLLAELDLRVLVRELFLVQPYPQFVDTPDFEYRLVLGQPQPRNHETMRMVSESSVLENWYDATVHSASQSSISERRHAETMRMGSESSIPENWYDETMRMVSQSRILDNWYDQTMRMVSQSSIPECRTPRILPFIHLHTHAQN